MHTLFFFVVLLREGERGAYLFYPHSNVFLSLIAKLQTDHELLLT